MLDLAGLTPGRAAAVLDPACGSGAILMGAASRLGAGGTLHGVDVDPQLIALARTNLEPISGSVTLDASDALGSADGLAGRFDLVLSNPPYVAWHWIDPTIRRRLEGSSYLGCALRGRIHHPDQQPNLGLFFVLLGLHALRPGGRLVYLLPPEWLTASRAAGLRARLSSEATVRQVVVFEPGMRLFPRSGPGGEPIKTGSMLLVADRDRPPPEHRTTLVRVLNLGASRPAALAGVSAWIRGAAGSPTPAEACRLEVEQARLDAGRWRVLESREGVAARQGGASEGRGRRTSLPGGEPRVVRISSPTMPLSEVTGVRVAGGHQPRVAWLDWLELGVEEREALPEAERRWLWPAVREAASITYPVLAPPSRWWVLLPRNLRDEAAARAIAPALMAMMRRRVEAALAAGEWEGGGSGGGGAAGPARWWEFPNRRNLELFTHPGPRLLAPRTAAGIQVCFDRHGHMIKGTNTVIGVGPGSPFSPQALFGLLNSAPIQHWVREHGRPYHDRRVLQEPRDIARLPVPVLAEPGQYRLLSGLEAAVGEVLAGRNAWNAIHSIAFRLYT